MTYPLPDLTVSRPQVRNTEEPFNSRLAAFFKRNTEVLDKLAVEMYAPGLSTRDVEDALMEAMEDRSFRRQYKLLEKRLRLC